MAAREGAKPRRSVSAQSEFPYKAPSRDANSIRLSMNVESDEEEQERIPTPKSKGKARAITRDSSEDELHGDFSPRAGPSNPLPPLRITPTSSRTTTAAVSSLTASAKKRSWPSASNSDLEILLDNPHFKRNTPPSSAAATDDDDDDDEPLIFTEPIKRPPLASSSTKGTNPESLANLSCPICLGPPTPLAMTICGHAFCGGCLHESLLSGPELTPPPEANGLGRYGFGPGTGAHGAGRGNGAARRGGRTGGGAEGLDARCPVCRTVLRGGWSRSLRGVIIRMAVVEDP